MPDEKDEKIICWWQWSDTEDGYLTNCGHIYYASPKDPLPPYCPWCKDHPVEKPVEGEDEC